MFIAVGPQRQRLDPYSWASEVAVRSAAKAHMTALQPVFLEFGQGLFCKLQSEAEIEMASRLVFLFHTRDFDSDQWIAEARAMEEHYAESEDARDDPDSEEDSTKKA